MSTVYHFLTTLDRLLHLARGIDTFHPDGPACPLRYVGGAEILRCLRGGDLVEWEAKVAECKHTRSWLVDYAKLKSELLAIALRSSP
jgi:hypothetical protein